MGKIKEQDGKCSYQKMGGHGNGNSYLVGFGDSTLTASYDQLQVSSRPQLISYKIILLEGQYITTEPTRLVLLLLESSSLKHTTRQAFTYEICSFSFVVWWNWTRKKCSNPLKRMPKSE